MGEVVGEEEAVSPVQAVFLVERLLRRERYFHYFLQRFLGLFSFAPPPRLIHLSNYKQDIISLISIYLKNELTNLVLIKLEAEGYHCDRFVLQLNSTEAVGQLNLDRSDDFYAPPLFEPMLVHLIHRIKIKTNKK